MFAIALFALALNMDAFAAGTAYGMRKIHIPMISIVVISLISILAITISMLAGKMVARFIPVYLAHMLGGGILLVIGILIIYQTYRNNTDKKREVKHKSEPLLQIHIKPLGLIAQVVREPVRADMDQSGHISPIETLLLGTALCVDAFIAGFAVSMLGFDVLMTALIVGAGHFLLFTGGIIFGKFLKENGTGRRLSLLPGLILIILGVMQILEIYKLQ